MTSRGRFLGAVSAAGSAVVLGAAPARAAAGFDRAAFEARIRAPYLHRQAFGSGAVSDGAVFGFMANSLDAYEHGFGEGPGTLHAVAVLYRTAVVMALDDDAWKTFDLAQQVQHRGDTSVAIAGNGNPYLYGPAGRAIPELLNRGASLFVCDNALHDVARRLSTSIDVLRPHLIAGAFVVPAGVAAINALQEERYTLFVAAA